MAEPEEVRAHLVGALEADLVGPFDPAVPEEVLPLTPSRWYLTGFLAPSDDRETYDPTSDEAAENGTEDDPDEATTAEPEAKRPALFPSSMGLTVLLPDGKATDVVNATVSFAEYRREARALPDGKERYVWRRTACGPFAVPVQLDAKNVEGGFAVEGAKGLVLKGKLGRANVRGLDGPKRALSLFVVNEREPVPKTERALADERFIFQVKLALDAPMGLVARPNRRGEGGDDWDEQVAELQFRTSHEWAVGHNVATKATAKDGEATHVETTWVPSHEVRRVVTHEVDGLETRMEELAKLTEPAALRDALGPLADAYEAWVRVKEAEKVGSDARMKTRDILMKRAKETCARIRDGVALLVENADAREAFTLACGAMARAARQRSPEDYDAGQAPKWRLFQLAFVLQSLRGIVDPTHDDRKRVDLIYFPTGGGKTEAYLGVIAFALLLRRIHARGRPDQGLGVAVMLRYTLRLLTLDQLSRATTLVCALEEIRKRPDARLGDVRFSVGLWVGRAATPNKMEEARTVVSDYIDRGGRWPCPLTHCPWCKHPLDGNSFDLRPRRGKPVELITSCIAVDCPFNVRRDAGGLPLVWVDEQLYRELPTFLVATVDKFAMLPWRGETGKLFGRVTARDGGKFYGPLDGAAPKGSVALPDGLRPPDLIVQDELHLIAGPLGTMVGLYETAVDYLSTSGDAPPKIVASTATVRRAREHVRSLFGRDDFALFPPPGIDDSETWFGRVETAKPGRLYVGIAAPGRSLKGILLRTYVDLLCAAHQQWGAKGENAAAADAFTTLVGYFNSLRELGGMRRLVEDDVRSRCEKILERIPEDRKGANPWFAARDVKAMPEELTSRASTAAIAEAKARLNTPRTDRKQHVDVVLASNMISVGIDIDRLGLMVIAGQPKTTSEYIQASSRVGRKLPGLVVTCFNVRRPRDRSHYERFAAYHETFYRHVEAQSLTPFSGPALDRGLAGTLVAMTRLSALEATPPTAAARIAKFKAVADRAAAYLGSRAARETADERVVEKRARNLLDAWVNVARAITQDAASTLDYSKQDLEKAATRHLLFTVLDEPKPDPKLDSDAAKFAAPTSMRDVEPSVPLWLKRGSLGENR